ncbi:hypothetical protein IIA94_02690, partial [Patescibacteria group bacterium]|nr:hypothetical protein [Patescibacteria group bacterium]
QWNEGAFFDVYQGNQHGQNIIRALRQENEEKRFYFLLEIILNLAIINQYGPRAYMIEYSREKLIEGFLKALEFSNVNLAVSVKNEKIILYPKGEKKFDEELVDEVLSFLNSKSQQHFVDALNSYEKGTVKNSIKSAESLRRSLEEFLRFKLDNQQGLDKNIKTVQQKLKSSQKSAIIRNIIFQIFSYLDQYFNENSKHKDGNIDEPENEFLIYQTGILMRYIQRTLN